jgi:hypothetical protein
VAAWRFDHRRDARLPQRLDRAYLRRLDRYRQHQQPFIRVSHGRWFATYQIEVDSWILGNRGQTDTVQLWAQNTEITDPTVTSQWVVPSGWLTPVATGVPPGWSLLASPATAQWIHADDEGNQVVLQGASGDTALFTREAPGYYQSQPGNNDHLNIDGNGQLQLATSDNRSSLRTVISA